MNIGFFTDTYFPQVSGVSTSIKLLKQALETMGHHVVIFTTTDPDAQPEVDVIRLPSVPFASFEDRRIAYAGFDKCLRIAKKYQLDMIHTHTEFSLGLAGKYVASRLKIPSIHTYHTLYEQYTHYIMSGLLIRPMHVRYLSRLFCNQTEGVVVPSDMMRDKLRGYGVKTPIRVISTGVQLPQIDSASRRVMRQKLGLAEDDIVLLSLSRLSKEKSLDQVITMYSQVVSQMPQARLVMVGDGPDRERLERLADTHQVKVNFVGEVPFEQVAQYYQMADLYVNASTSETQGLTYLEAFANHLPIVAHYNDYLASIMTNPSFGALFDETHSFASVVLDYLQAKANNKIGQIDNDLLYPFSVNYFAEQISDYYQDILLTYHKKDHSFFDRIYGSFKEGYKEMFDIPNQPKVGFIGLGVMGKSMAKHLMAEGYDLVVYNRTASKATELIKEGAQWAATPKAVAESCDIVFTIVGYPADVEEVYFGETGLFAGHHANSVFIDMTTSTPSLAIKIAERARQLHIHVLDAPVSGGDKGAREGILTTMVGGEQAIFDQVLPLLHTFSAKVRLQGSHGAGQHTKMANQIMIAGTMLGMSELLVYAKATGLNLDNTLDTVGAGSAQNWSLANYGPRILKEDFAPGFYAKHFLKDLKIALDEAEKLQLDLPMTKLARDLYQRLCDQGFDNEGTQALIKIWWEN